MFFRKSHDKLVGEFIAAEREYSARKVESEAVDQMVRWIVKEDADINSNEEALTWLSGRRQKVIDRDRALREESFERRMKKVDKSKMTELEIQELHDRIMTEQPVIRNDELLVMDDIKRILDENDFTWYSETSTTSQSWLDRVIKFASKKRLSVKEQLDWMCRQIQVDIEKIRLLIQKAGDVEDKYWRQAGDILIPLYENLFERGIKHEILTKVRPGRSDDYDEFGSDLDIKEIVKTRAEMEEQKKKDKERYNE